MKLRPRVLMVGFVGLSVITAACGASQSEHSPVAPTTAAQATGSTGTGSPPTPLGNDNNEAEFTGAITALAGACPTLQITINGLTIATTASTVFDSAPAAASPWDARLK